MVIVVFVLAGSLFVVAAAVESPMDDAAIATNESKPKPDAVAINRAFNPRVFSLTALTHPFSIEIPIVPLVIQ